MVAATVSHSIIWIKSCLLIRLLARLGVYEGIAQDSFFSLQIVGYSYALNAPTLCISERVLCKISGQSTQADSVESDFELL